MSLNGFVSYNDKKTDYTNEGIKVNVLNKLYLRDKVIMSVNLSNTNSEEIVFNKSHSYENMYLKLNNGVELRTNTSVLSGEEKSIVKNQELNFILNFDIPDLSHSSIDSIVIKDVYFTKTNETKDIVFKL
ncbi:hypothetical protein D3C71_1754780 [compost metagenome]